MTGTDSGEGTRVPHLRLLNVGCGAAVHQAWVNIDLVATAPGVMAHDLRLGLPFADETFDAVYSSHVLEHLTRGDGESLLREVHRVLRPGGAVRLVVPDLEGMARAYLDSVSRATRGDAGAGEDHEWMVIELVDQLVRQAPGGSMATYLMQVPLANRDFVLSRLGVEAERVWNPPPHAPVRRPSLWSLVARLRQELASVAVRVIGGREASQGFREGRFRGRGEVHRWMYDRVSLRTALMALGFTDVLVMQAGTSRIPEFDSYQLDRAGERVRKPDSLFVEGVRA